MPLPCYVIVCVDCQRVISTCACDVEKVTVYHVCRECEAEAQA